jgi:hypothetical protein
MQGLSWSSASAKVHECTAELREKGGGYRTTFVRSSRCDPGSYLPVEEAVTGGPETSVESVGG